MKNSLLIIVEKLLSKNKIAFDKKELAFQIESHPSYPSLHAITGVLDHFNIENVAAEVPKTSETLLQLPDTFIAQITTENGNDLITASKIKGKQEYYLFSESKKNKKILEKDFLNVFTGIIVAVEKNESENIKPNTSLKNIILFSLVSLLIITTLINQNTSFINLCFILLSVLGIISSQSILKQEMGENTVIGDAFCSGNNEKKDCDAVLTSKGAEIIKDHKLSDLSILYFSGLLTASLLLKNLNILYLISFLAVPITLYSIYYQKYIVKSWCTLCLSIVGILWLQTALATTQINSLNNLSLNSLIITSISFISIYLIWGFVKPLFKDVIELQKEKVEAVKFKRNFNLFNSLLKKSPTLNTIVESENEIVFGNKNAPLEIVIITNPFCGHCKPVHKTINKILDRYNDSVKIIIRFNVSIKTPEANATIVTSRLIELYNTKGENECKNAMNDIYGDMKLDKWISKWNKVSDFNLHSKTLQLESEWCTENAINFTPEILINGKSFPKEYKREDLLFFIEDLEESNALVANNI